MLRKAAVKEDSCCRSCGTVSLFSCCKSGSCIVVLLFIFVLVVLRAVWYCFLVVSGKSSTVLAVLYCYFNLIYKLENTKATSPILASSFITRAWSRFKLPE